MTGFWWRVVKSGMKSVGNVMEAERVMRMMTVMKDGKQRLKVRDRETERERGDLRVFILF